MFWVVMLCRLTDTNEYTLHYNQKHHLHSLENLKSHTKNPCWQNMNCAQYAYNFILINFSGNPNSASVKKRMHGNVSAMHT